MTAHRHKIDDNILTIELSTQAGSAVAISFGICSFNSMFGDCDYDCRPIVRWVKDREVLNSRKKCYDVCHKYEDK